MTTEVKEIQAFDKMVDSNGNVTLETAEAFQRLVDAIRELQALRVNIAAVTKPTGGATVDAEARTAIDAIIDSA